MDAALSTLRKELDGAEKELAERGKHVATVQEENKQLQAIISQLSSTSGDQDTRSLVRIAFASFRKLK